MEEECLGSQIYFCVNPSPLMISQAHDIYSLVNKLSLNIFKVLGIGLSTETIKGLWAYSRLWGKDNQVSSSADECGKCYDRGIGKLFRGNGEQPLNQITEKGKVCLEQEAFNQMTEDGVIYAETEAGFRAMDLSSTQGYEQQDKLIDLSLKFPCL